MCQPCKSRRSSLSTCRRAYMAPPARLHCDGRSLRGGLQESESRRREGQHELGGAGRLKCRRLLLERRVSACRRQGLTLIKPPLITQLPACLHPLLASGNLMMRACVSVRRRARASGGSELVALARVSLPCRTRLDPWRGVAWPL